MFVPSLQPQFTIQCRRCTHPTIGGTCTRPIGVTYLHLRHLQTLFFLLHLLLLKVCKLFNPLVVASVLLFFSCVKRRAVLLDLTRCGGRSLTAHAGGVDGFGRDQIQVLVIWNLIQSVAVLQELDVEVLVDLLRETE